MSLYIPGFCLYHFILRWYGQRESSLSHYQDTSDDGINRSEMKGCDCGNIWLLIIPSCRTLRREGLAHKEHYSFNSVSIVAATYNPPTLCLQFAVSWNNALPSQGSLCWHKLFLIENVFSLRKIFQYPQKDGEILK